MWRSGASEAIGRFSAPVLQKLTASLSAADGDQASEEKVHAEAGRAARKGSRVGSPQAVPIIEDQHIAKYLTQIGNRLVAAAPTELKQSVYEYSSRRRT
jgi:predicted Zn-dependent protease